MGAFQRSLPLADLVALRRNPQYLTPHEMEALKTSIARDGFLAPVLVRELADGRYEIVSGNHRVMAARELGYTEIPCIVAELSDAQAQRVAVNLNTVHGNPTPELLAPFLAEMDRAVLATVHLDEQLLAGVKQIDAELAATLATLTAPPTYDSESSLSPIGKCVCDKCGKPHIRAGANKRVSPREESA